jgi:hypothetical protein
MEEPFNKNTAHSQFLINRIKLMKAFSGKKDILHKVVMEGIDNEDEEKVARAACSFLLADIEYELSGLGLHPEKN